MHFTAVSQRRTTIAVAAALAAVFVAATVFFATRDGDGSSERPRRAAPTAPAQSPISLGRGVPAGTTIGVVVSNAGPGRNVSDLAAGAYVAAFRLNGATESTDRVRLLVRDDGGDAAAAARVVDELAAEGVAGIVYASTGEQFGAAARAAGARGVALLAPYAGDESGLAEAPTTFLTGASDRQAAGRLASFAKGEGWAKVALLFQPDAYGERGRNAVESSGLALAAAVPFDPGAPTLAAPLAAALASQPDAVVVWGDVDSAAKAVAAIDAANSTVPVVLGPRAGVPAFGRTQIGQLAASAVDGLLSIGVWAHPSTPTLAIDTFFDAKTAAVARGGVTADLATADFASHDAVLAIAEAARQARTHQAAAVLAELRQLVFGTAAHGGAGVPLDFARPTAVADSAAAMLVYSTVDDGSGRFPPVPSSGGHWVAVDGSFEYPPDLAGLGSDNGG